MLQVTKDNSILTGKTTLRAAVERRALAIGPAWFAFIGSLLLSAIAVLDSPGPNRDGMLYIDTARVYLESGFDAAKANFNWPFLPVLIGLLSRLTSIGVEASAYLICALLMAGSCAALVQLTKRQFPVAEWAAVIVVLSLPAINGYRADVVREFGYWLFCLSGFLYALKWSDRPTWAGVAVIQMSFFVACLFRLEAVALYPALVLWQFFGRTGEGRWQRMVMLLTLPIAAVVVVLGLAASGVIAVDGRVAYYLAAVDPVAKYSEFTAVADRMGEAILPKYSLDEAPSILFFGLLSIIPVHFVDKMGVFLVLPLMALRAATVRELLSSWQPLSWGFLLYILVLIAFLIEHLFLTGRYVVLLGILMLPLFALGLSEAMRRAPRWRGAMVVVAVLLALGNVVSFSDKKTQFPEAGAWIQSNISSSERIYFGSPRTAYHAGQPYALALAGVMSPEQLSGEIGRFDVFVLEVPREDKDLRAWLDGVALDEVQRFANDRGDAVVIARPRL